MYGLKWHGPAGCRRLAIKASKWMPLLLVLVASCVVVTDNGNDNGNDNGSAVARTFVGAGTCMPCHSAVHTNWTSTTHATALETLREIGQETNPDCLACHTVGYNEGGFVDEAGTPELAGVQCENCHGPAGEHAANPVDTALRPVIDVSSDVCGECHTDFHHPTYDEWQLSKHARALQGLLLSQSAENSCLQCHSQDYRYAVEQQEAGDTDVTIPTLETAQNSVECSTCHAPHGGLGLESQLRMSIGDLCGQCHTTGESVIDDSPHQPQFEMVAGEGAFAADASELTVGFSPHALLLAEGGQACAQCHVVRHDLEDPNEGTPNVTGHTFNPFDSEITAISPEHQASQYDGCLLCHGTADTAEEKRVEVQGDIAIRLVMVSLYFLENSDLYIDPENLSEEDQDRLAIAKFNYEFVNADGSQGVHNSFYADAALQVAEDIVADLSQ